MSVLLEKIDLRTLHLKWQKKWEEANVYNANANEKKEKKFITAAFPYPNSPQHIGHGRTYTVADAYARYWRMKGYNVLFPMGFHVTGTPIISMAKKIEEKDNELLAIFEKIYGIERETAATLTNPTALVLYFSAEIERGMKEIGYSIDWRRKFFTFDARFNKFIEWQFLKLKQFGYLKIGEHPVPWCPRDNNAVSAHDTKGDVDPELEEVIVIKFPFEDGSIVVSTYRPETLFGVTNIWVNPSATYVKVRYDKEILYLAEDASKNMLLQFNFEILEKINGSYFINKNAKSPLSANICVPIFAASFVKPDAGTGIVMSVPAHAPYDYLALRDLGKLNVIKLIKIVEVSGYDYDIPAKEMVERFGVKNQDDPLAEKATDELYKIELYEGRMKVESSEYNGIASSDAREKIKAKLISENKAMQMQIIANAPIFCRCGANILVNMVKNQWFIDYGNDDWKKLAKECLEQMSIIPERARTDYINTIDWLKAKACVRAKGLGTPFPFDKSQIIESLSDSTIYTAYYTISHLLNEIPVEELDEEFFDYVFLGKCKRNENKTKKMEVFRENFLYWYPVDSRHSGADLVRNHLVFFMFNHAAIFPKDLWPKQIVTNGFVLMEGKKMSKSLGNILSLRSAIAEYGADVVRLSIISGADLGADTDFSNQVAHGVESRLKIMLSLAFEAGKKSASEEIDFWLLSRLNRHLEDIDKRFQTLEYREIVKGFLYDTCSDLNWYLKRAKKPHLKEFFEKWVVAIAPFAPHIAEEIWHAIKKDSGFVVNASMVLSDTRVINNRLEMREEFIAGIIKDVERISSLTGTKPKKAILFVAVEWKYDAYEIARAEKNFESAMKKCMHDPSLKSNAAELAKFIKQLGKNIFSLKEVLKPNEEMETLSKAREFIAEQLNLEVEINFENDSYQKAKNAIPGRPGIVLEI